MAKQTFKNGVNITSDATENEIALTSPFQRQIKIEMVSGSVAFGVGDTNTTNVITGTHRIYSVAGNTATFTIEPIGGRNLFYKGVGVFTVTW